MKIRRINLFHAVTVMVPANTFYWATFAAELTAQHEMHRCLLTEVTLSNWLTSKIFKDYLDLRWGRFWNIISHPCISNTCLDERGWGKWNARVWALQSVWEIWDHTVIFSALILFEAWVIQKAFPLHMDRFKPWTSFKFYESAGRPRNLWLRVTLTMLIRACRSMCLVLLHLDGHCLGQPGWPTSAPGSSSSPKGVR